MNRQEAKEVLQGKELVITEHQKDWRHSFVDWLYDSGLELCRTADVQAENEKKSNSEQDNHLSFIEEVKAFSEDAEFIRLSFNEFVIRFAEIIDKHKGGGVRR